MAGENTMTARATFESRCWEALAAHGAAIADGTLTRVADPAFIDALLKAWEKSLADLSRTSDRTVAEVERLIALHHHPGDRAMQHTAPRRAVLDEAGRR